MILFICISLGLGLLIICLIILSNQTLFPLDHSQFHDVAKSLQEAILLLKSDISKVVYSSPHFMEKTGLDPKNITNYSLRHIVYKEDYESVSLSLKEGKTSPFDIEFRTNKDNEVSWFRMRGFPVRIRLKKRIALIIENISKQKDDQLQLAKARDYEISVGAKIQQALLLGKPEHDNPGFEISSMSIPSQKIDGDFYDFFNNSKQRIDVLVGDVMGKGIPAALTGAAAKNAFLRARMEIADEHGKSELDLKEIVTKAEKILSSSLIKLKTFLTIVYGRIDTKQSLFTYIDCGHTSVIHYEATSGQCWRLKGADMPIGFVAKQKYREYAVPIQYGDILFLFSDGISEAANSEDVMFGEERLMKLIKSNSELNASDLLEKIKQITFAYSAGQFRDDVTGVSIKIKNHLSVFNEETKEFPFTLNSLRDMRNFFSKVISEHTTELLREDEKETIRIAIGEAVANVLKHNSTSEESTCRAHYKISSDWLYFALYYNGVDFDWQDSDRPDPMSYQTGGYGLSLMNEAMDSVTISLGDENHTKLGMLYKIKNRDSI